MNNNYSRERWAESDFLFDPMNGPSMFPFTLDTSTQADAVRWAGRSRLLTYSMSIEQACMKIAA